MNIRKATLADGLSVAGRLHGMLFLLYIVAALLLSPSKRWPLWKMMLAGLCSAPPYGSLVFEQWAGQIRNYTLFQRLRAVCICTKIQ